MKNGKSSTTPLSELAPIRWFLPPHLEFEVAASISECLEQLNSESNRKSETTFNYKQVSDGEASFKISRLRNRTLVICSGRLHQVDEGKTLFHADMANTNILALVVAVIGSLPLIVFGTHPAWAIICALPIWWLTCLFSAWIIYQAQCSLAFELESLFR